MNGGNEVLYFPLSLMVVGHLKFLGIYSYCLSKYRLCLEEIKCLNVMFVYLYFFQYNGLIIIVIKHKIVLLSHSNHHINLDYASHDFVMIMKNHHKNHVMSSPSEVQSNFLP